MTPKYNDPVTTLVDGILVHGRWIDHVGGERFTGVGKEKLFQITRNGITGSTHTSWVTLSDEGKTWVRGHVDENDPAGAALLTIHALQPRSIDVSTT